MRFFCSSRDKSLAKYAYALALSAVCTSAAHGADINKCIVTGKTVYQEAPCAGGGKTLKLQSEIPKEQMWEANRRASDERQRSTGLEMKRRNDAFQEQVRARNEQVEREKREAMDCGRLAKEVEAAETQLAGARPSQATRAMNRERGTLMSEKDAKAESDSVDRAVGAANSRLITARMNQQNAGCK